MQATKEREVTGFYNRSRMMSDKMKFLCHRAFPEKRVFPCEKKKWVSHRKLLELGWVSKIDDAEQIDISVSLPATLNAEILSANGLKIDGRNWRIK